MPDGLRLAKLVRATLDDGGATLRWGVTRELATAAGLRPAAVEALHELLEAAASSEPVHLRVVLGALQELGFRPWLQPVVARIAQRLGGDSPPGRTRWELTWWSLAEAAGYRGLVEVEVFQPELWAMGPAAIAAAARDAALAHG